MPSFYHFKSSYEWIHTLYQLSRRRRGFEIQIVQVPVSVNKQKKLNIHKIVGWETCQTLDLLYFCFFFTAIKLVSYFEFMFGWFFCHNDRLMNSGHLLIIFNLFSLFVHNTQYSCQWVRFLTTITIYYFVYIIRYSIRWIFILSHLNYISRETPSQTIVLNQIIKLVIGKEIWIYIQKTTTKTVILRRSILNL